MTIDEIIYLCANKHELTFYINDNLVDLDDLENDSSIIGSFTIEENVVRFYTKYATKQGESSK